MARSLEELRLPQIRALLALGDASYSLYLGRLFALGAARVAWAGIGLTALARAATLATTTP
ncbi:MAG: hypothetical protein KGJ52_04775 [Gammaproteobacteria bacterium]|nr:hypothetical protein [Gammaproteobacteria bacterium]